MSSAVVIQFAKAPLVGQVKTRLEAMLGVQACVKVHKALVRHCFMSLYPSENYDFQLWVSEQHDFFRELAETSGADVMLVTQWGEDLGERMHNALSRCLNTYRFAVLVGSDCPAIDTAYVEEAVNALQSGARVVIGPARDGGYGLIAAREVHPDIFTGIAWGSGAVLQQTRERLTALRWVWQELPVIEDIDRPEDLAHLNNYPGLDFFASL